MMRGIVNFQLYHISSTDLAKLQTLLNNLDDLESGLSMFAIKLIKVTYRKGKFFF